MNTDLESFLNDLLSLFIERAIDANNRRKGAGIGAENEDYEAGRAQAYYEVVSTTINMALAFSITADSLPLLRFDADKELLS